MSNAVIAVPTTVPAGLATGTWTIDPSHSEVSFSVRHLMVSKVRGSFRTFSGDIEIAPEVTDSKVNATIEAASIDTRDEGRDAHLRSGDFFDVEAHPTVTFRSTAVRAQSDGFTVDGELTLHGVTRPVSLDLEFNGSGPDPYGGIRAGFSASTEINRRDFGVDISMPLDGGGVVVGDKVKIHLEIEAVLQAASN